MTEHITTSQMEVHYIEHMGNDLRTVDAARVSMKKRSEWWNPEAENPRLNQRDAKLIDYLGKHHHKSPFNHNALTVYVKAPIFVARQLVKHEYLIINEISRRYVSEPPEFYIPSMWRKKADNVKQGSLHEPVNIEGERLCEYCGDTFSVGRYTTADGEGVTRKRFCSVVCQQAHYRKYTDEGWATVKLCGLRQSAKKRGLECSIEKVDLLELGRPRVCKYLGIELDYTADTQKANSPSVNRIDATKGYVKGNIEIISKKANSMLQDASEEELRTFVSNVSLVRYGTFFEQAPSVEGYYTNMKNLYRRLIDEQGLCPEQARMFMPQSMFTEFFWTGTLGAWAKMVNLRDHPDAQQETREVALKVDAIARDLWPHSWEALRKYNVR